MKANVSVLIATYNSDYTKLIGTIASAILQEEVNVDIVIADDGSEANHRDEVASFFAQKGFVNYIHVINKQNRGTVSNILSGLDCCKSEYVKLISPGDYLFSNTTLAGMLSNARKTDAEMVFGDIVYYDENKEGVETFRHTAWPQDVRPYQYYDREKMCFNCLVMNDTIHGVSTLCKVSTLKKYLSMVKERVKYAEDTVYRLMIAEGVKVGYFPNNVALYAYGRGISTQKASKWKQKIKNDVMEANQMIIERIEDRHLMRNFQRSCNLMESHSFLNRVLFYMLCPRAFFSKFRRKLKPRYTSTAIDLQFMNAIQNEIRVGKEII